MKLNINFFLIIILIQIKIYFKYQILKKQVPIYKISKNEILIIFK